MTSQDKSSNSDSKKHSHHDHDHHDHKNCGHHHDDHHEHDHHDHENCTHDHHNHEHGPHCNHEHENPEKYQRHTYNSEELANFNSQGVETLILSVNDLLENEYYGKAVPILEIISLKLISSSADLAVHLFETKHHLALSYGIIGEHDKSLPLWKEVIAGLEKQDDIHETLEAYYNAALSAEQAKEEKDFLMYLNNGLEIAKSKELEEWVATFEHELGVHYFDNNEFKTSEAKLTKAIEIFTKLNEDESVISSYYYLAYLYEKQNNISKAKETYEKGLKLSKEESIRDFVEYERSLIEERLSNLQNSQLQNKLLNF